MRRAVAFVLAVVLLVAGTVFAFVAASTTEGADDPESAVRDLLEAISRRDAIGVIESLPLAEREAWRDQLPAIVDELQRLGVISPLSLSSIPGVTVEFRKVGYHTNKLWGEVGRVTLTSGEMVITPEAAAFPLSERTREWLERDFSATVDPASGAHTVDIARWRPNIVAVKDGGGWHPSLYYTLAEAVRGGGTGPMPRFGQGPMATGAGTPSAAVQELLTATANLDAARAVALTLPTEARALYDYSTLLMPEVRRQAIGLSTDDRLSIELEPVELVVSGEGTTREVRVVSLDAKITDVDDELRLGYHDSCLRTTRSNANDPGLATETTTCDGSFAPLTTAGDESKLYELTAWQGLGRAFPTFVVLERQGRWFISPTRSVLVTVSEILHGLQPADVEVFTDRVGDLWELYALPWHPSTGP